MVKTLWRLDICECGKDEEITEKWQIDPLIHQLGLRMLQGSKG